MRRVPAVRVVQGSVVDARKRVRAQGSPGRTLRLEPRWAVVSLRTGRLVAWGAQRVRLVRSGRRLSLQFHEGRLVRVQGVGHHPRHRSRVGGREVREVQRGEAAAADVAEVVILNGRRRESTGVGRPLGADYRTSLPLVVSPGQRSGAVVAENGFAGVTKERAGPLFSLGHLVSQSFALFLAGSDCA